MSEESKEFSFRFCFIEIRTEVVWCGTLGYVWRGGEHLWCGVYKNDKATLPNPVRRMRAFRHRGVGLQQDQRLERVLEYGCKRLQGLDQRFVILGLVGLNVKASGLPGGGD